MKPDWQNKSYAKSGAATGPSTMHSKLKVGMSSLHSKIGVANSNMPQAPKPVAKPAIRKFADGGMVRGGGVMSDEDYAKRMEQGEKNMERLRSAADSVKSFFTREDKPSASNITGDSGMSASDMAKKEAMSGGAQKQAAPAEEKRREISDYMVKPAETESKTEIAATPVEKKTSSAKKSVSSQNAPAATPKADVKMTGSPNMPTSNTKSSAAKAESSEKPAKKTYRTVSGEVKTYTPAQEKPANERWGVQNIVPNVKRYAGAVSDYVKNFETPAERRSRERKEGK